MRAPTILLALALVGCAGPSPKIPHADHFDQLDIVTELPDVSPAELPDKPAPTFIEVEGQEAAAFVGPEADALNVYIKTLQANTEIAREASQALRASDAERRALIEAGRLTEERANFLSDELTRERQAREHAEWMRSLEGWAYKALLLGLLVIGL